MDLSIQSRSISAMNNSLNTLKILCMKDFNEAEDSFPITSPLVSTETTQNSTNVSMKKLIKCESEIIIQPKFQENAPKTPINNPYVEEICNKVHVINQSQSTHNLQEFIIHREALMDTDFFSKKEKIISIQNLPHINDLKLNFQDFEQQQPENIKKLSDEITLTILKKHFLQNYLFWDLNEETIKSVIPNIFLKEVKPGAPILAEGEVPTIFFIVQSGIVRKETIKQGQMIKTMLDKGRVFGEKSLFHQAKRSSSYYADDHCNCLLWGINIAIFSTLIKTNARKAHENLIFISKIDLFKHLNENIREQIALTLVDQKFQKNDVILEPGATCYCFFIVKTGSLILKTEKNKIIKKLKPGEYIGEYSFTSFFCSYFIEAGDDNTHLLVISNKKLKNIGKMQENLYSLYLKNQLRIALSQSNFFSQLSTEVIEKIIANLQILCYKKNQVIIKKGQSINSLYIVFDGNLTRKSHKNNEETIVCEEFSLFGENCLINGSKLKPDESIIMSDNGTLGEITRKSIEEILGMKLDKTTLEKIKEQQSLIIKGDFPSKGNKKENFNIEDFEVVSDNVESGQFGFVLLSKYHDNHFALKICPKDYIISRKFELYARTEKIILSSLDDFPFLPKFYGSFKDESFLFLLMDYINGYDLMDICYNTDGIPLDLIQLYTAQLILTIEYLHSKNIIHRDIKLNNIMIDSEGNIKLIDFGIAKFLLSTKTYSLIGTPHYMAPEMINGKGYDYSVDIWGIGICIYELFFQTLPFENKKQGSEEENPLEIYKRIISTDLNFDKRINSLPYEFKDLLLKFLNIDPTKRLNLLSNSNEIKANKFFESIVWKDVYEKKISTGLYLKKINNLNKCKTIKLAEFLKAQRNTIKKERKSSQLLHWDEIF